MDFIVNLCKNIVSRYDSLVIIILGGGIYEDRYN